MPNFLLINSQESNYSNNANPIQYLTFHFLLYSSSFSVSFRLCFWCFLYASILFALYGGEGGLKLFFMVLLGKDFCFLRNTSFRVFIQFFLKVSMLTILLFFHMQLVILMNAFALSFHKFPAVIVLPEGKNSQITAGEIVAFPVYANISPPYRKKWKWGGICCENCWMCNLEPYALFLRVCAININSLKFWDFGPNKNQICVGFKDFVLCSYTWDRLYKCVGVRA